MDWEDLIINLLDIVGSFLFFFIGVVVAFVGCAVAVGVLD